MALSPREMLQRMKAKLPTTTGKTFERCEKDDEARAAKAAAHVRG